MLAGLLTNSFYRSEKLAKSWFKETIIKSSINLWPLPSLLTVLFNQSNVIYGAVHKRPHQSGGGGLSKIYVCRRGGEGVFRIIDVYNFGTIMKVSRDI